MRPPVLILTAAGTNRDRETAWACELAGAAPTVAHINEIIAGQRKLLDFSMLVLPGGFSFGDDLGAGKLWAVNLRLRPRLADELAAFVDAGRPVLGICNGFQVLVRAGLLPGPPLAAGSEQAVTLTRNDSGRFECRWVLLEPQPGSPCVFTSGLTAPFTCPVAHGEGKLVARDARVLQALQQHQLVALRYADPAGGEVTYPANPNGSEANIAGLCNSRGTVLGLMPHPEDHVIPQQHPRVHRSGSGERDQNGEGGGLGLALFTGGVRYAAEL